ncbi:MAG: hypothetical protein ABJK11_03875 [Balneola sp.]
MFSINMQLKMLLVAILPFMACKDDTTAPIENIPSLTVETQGTSNGNQVVIPELTIDQTGWVVIHRSNSNGNGPEVPAIIGKTKTETGTSTDVSIQLEEGVSNNEQLFAMLHMDTGVEGEYEFNGANTPDQPITLNGNVVTKPFSINQTNPELTRVEDQPNKGGVFEVDVNAAEDGWVVLHRTKADGSGPVVPPIIGRVQVSAGTNTNVFIPLDDGETVDDGDQLFAMLHYDTGTIDEYEFNGANTPDQPVVFEGSVVTKPFTVQANQSTLTANDQTIQNNSITVDVNATARGWVVVHRDNGSDGPNVPPIIAKTQIVKGMNSNVEISFGDSTVTDGEKLWPMVHYETGTVGEYEFEGAGTPDQPVIVGGAVLTKQITVSK